MKRQRAYAHLLAVAATYFAAGHASAQTPAAVPAPAAKAPPIAAPAVVRLSPTVQLAGQTLHLNGKGTRYRAVVRVYDIGLYATTKVSSLEQLAAAQLKVVFAVDMFNEGVDVPAIDTVMMPK